MALFTRDLPRSDNADNASCCPVGLYVRNVLLVGQRHVDGVMFTAPVTFFALFVFPEGSYVEFYNSALIIANGSDFNFCVPRNTKPF
jgi:hypothetical protein